MRQMLEGEVTKGTYLTGRKTVDDFIILIVVIVSWVYTDVSKHQIVHFKYMQFIVCQSYLKKAFS